MVRFAPLTYFFYIRPKLSDSCSICLEPICDSWKIIYCRRCYNVFHVNCMSHWQYTLGAISCPICRHNKIRCFWLYNKRIHFFFKKILY